MLNCKINSNITKECNTYVGGVQDEIFLYDISDVQSLTFTNDTRYDGGNSVSTINATNLFYRWNVSDISYEEKQKGDSYTHELTAKIYKTDEIENILSDAKNSKLLVCFRLNNEGYYRIFGWDNGAELSYSLSASDDGNYYTITFEDEGKYPAFEVDTSNFDLKNKVFEPIFVPDFNISTCETKSGSLTGYRIASYVTKQTISGMPLDEDNRLCEFSGKKQDAYKFSGVADGQYNIIGSYNDTAVYDGKAVKVYDFSHCSSTGSGTISASPNPIILTAHARPNITLNITTNDSWSLANNTSFADVSKYSGRGNSEVQVSWNGSKSQNSGTISVRNENTNETIDIPVRFSGVWLSGNDSADYTQNGFVTYVQSVGNRTISVTCDDQNVQYSFVDNGSNVRITFNSSGISPNGALFTIKATSSDSPSETDTFVVKVRGNETAPNWIAVSYYCEMVDGMRTNYKITKYRDSNPKSKTYGTTREERTLDDQCKVSGEDWQTVTSYCDKDSNGKNTGVLVIVEQQMNKGLPSYGSTRTRSIIDETACPRQTTDPVWVTISETCLTDTYGQNGQKESTQQDQNSLSPSFGDLRTIEEFDPIRCMINREPYWAELSATCLQNEGGNTGYEELVVIDQNPRSSKFGTTETQTRLNVERCPYGTLPIWEEFTRICTLDADGDNNGTLEIWQRNVNVHSSTYGETRKIEEYNTTACPLPSTEPRWELQSYECQLNAEGRRTGMCDKVWKDVNRKSESAGQIRTETVLDETLCADDLPNWKFVSSTCRTDEFGQDGFQVNRYVDVNPKSDTYQQTEDRVEYNPTDCVPNTEPYWRTDYSECETE